MNRANQIISAVAAAVAHIDDPRDRLARQVGMLQGEIRQLLPAVSTLRLPAGSFACEAHIDGLGDCTVHYDYSAGRAGVHTMPNGDPGYPDEPAELLVTAVQIAGIELNYEVFASDVQERLDAAAEADVERFAEQQQAEHDEWLDEREAA